MMLEVAVSMDIPVGNMAKYAEEIAIITSIHIVRNHQKDVRKVNLEEKIAVEATVVDPEVKAPEIPIVHMFDVEFDMAGGQGGGNTARLVEMENKISNIVDGRIAQFEK